MPDTGSAAERGPQPQLAGHHVMSQSGMSARPSRSGVYVAAAAPEGGRGVLWSGAAQLPRLAMAEEEPCLPAFACTRRESAAVAV